jgi:hypothetical protein
MLEKHVTYEIDMLVATYTLMKQMEVSKLVTDEETNKVICNALVESFAIHARNLIDFFNSKQGGNPKEFAPEYEPTVVNEIGSKLDRKLNTQIAHLTYQRTDDPKNKIGSGERETLLRHLLPEIDSFSRRLKDEWQARWPYATTPNSIGPKRGGSPAPAQVPDTLLHSAADKPTDISSSSISSASLPLGSS